jgi:cytochrome c oxidase subunit 1/cytochrome c oxidase subunit I+III
MHLTGLFGMPRRIYTYSTGMGWGLLNLITTIGAFVLAIGILLFLINVFRSIRFGAVAGPNPWDGPTLEWSVSSPPPPYNFDVIPVVASRHPLWEDRLEDSPNRSSLHEGLLLDHGRETIGTTPLDAEPDVILKMPGDSIAPLTLTIAMAVGFTGLLIHAWWLAGLGALGCIAAIAVWLWPERRLDQVAGAVHE